MAKSLSFALAALLLLAPAWLLAAPRVITLSPANTELAFAAGITPVGVSSYSDYPSQAKTIEQVASWQGMNLERIVSLYLDYAELQAERKIPMSMEDWAKRLDGFLEFNGNELLTGPGKISAEQAKLHAETEYEKYRVVQDRLYEIDFDRFMMVEEEANRKIE